MPSPQQLKDLAAAIEGHHARLSAAQAGLPPGPVRDQLAKSQELLTQTFQELQAATEKLNQNLASAVKSAKEAVESVDAKVAEKIRNAPKPKPRPVKVGRVVDPHLEEKLQLALRTPFGNRSNQPRG